MVMNGLLIQATIAFLVCPGTVAFLVPLGFLAPGGPDTFVNWLGLVPLGVGILLLLSCVREFYLAGRGTLAPWAPPEELVVTGPYRFSRNPMYLAVPLVLWGWALGFQSRPLATYAAVVMTMFYVRVVFFEEPWLARTHGKKWTDYRARVPRWFGVHQRPPNR